MERRRAIIAGTVAGLAAAGAIVLGATVAGAGGSEDNEAPITGAALPQAEAAALEHTGGGTVTETEVGDEESLYEVEVRMPDGSSVDVQLDKDFKVVGDKVDREEADPDD